MVEEPQVLDRDLTVTHIDMRPLGLEGRIIKARETGTTSQSLLQSEYF